MNITIRAHKLVYELLNLMPSPYQRSSLKAMLALFLRAQGLALPEHASHKSPSALSRFLNLYDWPTTSVIRALRREVLQVLLERRKVGRRPILRAIVDLTPLQKSGSFEGLAGLLHILNKKRGVQLGPVPGFLSPGARRKVKSSGFGKKWNFCSVAPQILPPKQPSN
ncbi:MAG: hypothetical protein H0V53_09200 [Rubrobacter sp.]|nr:hypothetical protein [Rubrobacter sp.]